MLNPAQRLLAILLDFDRHSEFHPNPYDNWRAALKLDPYAESEVVQICFVRVLQLSDEIRHFILCTPELLPHRFPATLSELRHYLLRYAFHDNVKLRKRHFPHVQLGRLEHIAQSYPAEPAAPPAIAKFQQQFAELHALVLSHEEIASETKEVLCEFLQIVIHAIEHYNISGARGVVTALDLALGAMSRHAPAVRETPENVQTTLYDILNRLDRFTAPLNEHDPHVGATLTLLGFGPPK